jgi:hypothetical protein
MTTTRRSQSAIARVGQQSTSRLRTMSIVSRPFSIGTTWYINRVSEELYL